jgi:hypothetical protein
LLLVCYAYFPPRWADWNQNSRLDLVLAIVDDQSATIDKYVQNTGDYAYFDGHYYSDKAPGTAFLGVPVYAVLRLLPEGAWRYIENAAVQNGALAATLREGSGTPSEKVRFAVVLLVTTALVVAVPSALLGVLFFYVAGNFGLTLGPRLAATLLYALGTSAFPYANSFVGHQIAAFGLFGAFAIMFAIRRGRLRLAWIPVAGFLLAYAFITEYPTGIMAGVLGLYALLTSSTPWRMAGGLVLGAIPPIVALAVYDYAAFGTVLPVGYAHSALWTDVHGVGFFSITYPRLDALWGLAFGVRRGLFFLSPYLVLSAVGYVALWRRATLRAEFWVLLLGPLGFLLLIASSAMWDGGFSVGPRYLVPVLPFIALVAGIGFARAWHNVVFRPAVVLLAAWSLFAIWVETIGGQAFPDYTPNPLFDLSLPRLAAGDVARNAGTLLGLSGLMSLAPLAAVVCPVLAFLAVTARFPRLILPARRGPRLAVRSLSADRR